MRYAQIRKMDISNGDGVGISLFTQGCPLHCKDCHNKEQWSYNGGKIFTTKEFDLILELCSKEWVDRFSILGGEPFIERNWKELNSLLTNIKLQFPHIKIWIYTGYTYEELLELSKSNEGNQYLLPIITSLADIIVDGPFIQEQKDITLAYKGSRNQRIIDVRETIKNNVITLYDI